MSTALQREPLVLESDAAIRLASAAHEKFETRWGLMLVIFMRVLAALWIVQGLREWSMFLLPPDELFARLSAGQTAAVIYFAVVDLLAAVGLWLATPWGGVLWLFAAVSQIVVAGFLNRMFTPLYIAIDLLCIALYFVLTWRASLHMRERR
jgi:hypothetical protein